MEEAATKDDEAVDAVRAYHAASEAALKAAQGLSEAWLRHLEQGTGPPTPDLISEVEALQMASDLALGRARLAMRQPGPVHTPQEGFEFGEPSTRKTRRTRRRENKVLTKIGRPGQRLLRAVLLILILLSGLVTISLGISLALEIAGLLNLIDDPVRLPVGIQLAMFVAAVAVVYGLKKVLKPVERALYGSKGIRPKSYQL